MPPRPRCRRNPFALLGWWLAAGLAASSGTPSAAARDPVPPVAAGGPARVNVVDIALDGLPDDETANARLAMTLARLSTKQRSELSEARLQFLLRRIPGEVTKALEPFGWYSPVVAVQREPARDGVRIRVDVDPGEPVRVKTLDADIDGAAKDDRFVMRELPKLRPAVGERFVHLDYESGKVRVERKLADRGYFDAKRTTARVAVSRAAKSADILLRWDSGPRHAMGEARFAPNQFRPGLLEPLVDWSPGEPYHRNKLDRLQARLAQLDYFALVEVLPAEEAKGQDLRMPIEIATTPAKRTAYSAALRFGSDTGVGVRGSMNRRWVNDRGHKWLSDFEWSQRRSGFTTQYRVPSLRRLPGWWGGRVEYLSEDPESALGYERLGLGLGWQGRRDPFALSGRVVYAEERTKLLRRDRFPDARQTMLYPEVTGTYRRVEDPLQPDDALQLSVALRAGVIEAASSRERFAQVELGAQWLHTLDDAQIVILRAEAAATAYGGSIESQAFPASLRYFAGGDRSIRGYGYREVGPRFEGETLGGLHRIVASAEYQYFFTEEWGAAVFVDAGDAFNTRSAFDPKVGVGVGARWRSPVGLVGVDVARGLDEAAGGGTRLHLSFGVGF